MLLSKSKVTQAKRSFGFSLIWTIKHSQLFLLAAMAPNHAVRWNCLLCDLFAFVPMHCGVPSFPPEKPQKCVLTLSTRKTNKCVADGLFLTAIVRSHLYCYYWRMALNYVHLHLQTQQKWLTLEYIPAKNIGYHCLDVLASFHRNRCHPRIETNVVSWVRSVINGYERFCQSLRWHTFFVFAVVSSNLRHFQYQYLDRHHSCLQFYGFCSTK